MCCLVAIFFFQAEDGIRDLVRSRGLGDVYKRQEFYRGCQHRFVATGRFFPIGIKRFDADGRGTKGLSLIHI